jgi:hypothetical protein
MPGQRVVRRVATVVALAAAMLATPSASARAAGPANGDVIRTWTSLAFDAVRQTGSSDANAARLYAMVDAAMYDAVNGLADEPRGSAIVPPSESKAGDPLAAAVTAAHDVLTAWDRDSVRRASYDTQLRADLARVPSAGQSKHGQAWGADVAAAVVADRAVDGSAGSEVQPAGTGAGFFRVAWDTHQRHLRPFVIADPGRYVDAGPPQLASDEYAVAFDDVKQVGSPQYVGEDGAVKFQFWKLSGGTNQPAGAWLQVADTVSEARLLSLADTARLFALESMAMADTVAPTYETKRTYDFWRPETAINEADLDGNGATTPAAGGWTARGGAATSPEHWSGHSSFSAAGAEVLAGFFCRDDIAFTLDTDSPGSAARSYPSLSAAAAEAGRSRVFGGQHFEFSNQAGLAAGRAIADEVLATALRRRDGATTCVR